MILSQVVYFSPPHLIHRGLDSCNTTSLINVCFFFKSHPHSSWFIFIRRRGTVRYQYNAPKRCKKYTQESVAPSTSLLPPSSQPFFFFGHFYHWASLGNQFLPPSCRRMFKFLHKSACICVFRCPLLPYAKNNKQTMHDDNMPLIPALEKPRRSKEEW